MTKYYLFWLALFFLILCISHKISMLIIRDDSELFILLTILCPANVKYYHSYMGCRSSIGSQAGNNSDIFASGE